MGIETAPPHAVVYAPGSLTVRTSESRDTVAALDYFNYRELARALTTSSLSAQAVDSLDATDHEEFFLLTSEDDIPSSLSGSHVIVLEALPTTYVQVLRHSGYLGAVDADCLNHWRSSGGGTYRGGVYTLGEVAETLGWASDHHPLGAPEYVEVLATSGSSLPAVLTQIMLAVARRHED